MICFASILQLGLLAPAYRPFIDPLPITGWFWWLTLIPLAFGVSMVYKAIRVSSNFNTYWREVLLMTLQILGAMIGLAIGVHILIEWLVPVLE